MDESAHEERPSKPKRSAKPPQLPPKPSYLAGNKTKPREPQPSTLGERSPLQRKSNYPTQPMEEQLQSEQQKQRYQPKDQRHQDATQASPANNVHHSLGASTATSIPSSTTPPLSHTLPTQPSFSSTRNATRLASQFDSFSKPTTAGTKIPLETPHHVPLHATLSSDINKAQHDPWNFDLLETHNRKTQKTSTSNDTTADLFGMKPFGSIHSVSGKPVAKDDNPLGILDESAPSVSSTTPSHKAKQTSSVLPSQGASRLKKRLSTSPTFSSTPAPRTVQQDLDSMVAQLVEMGFTAEQGQFAVEATGGSGLQAALDLLVQSADVTATPASTERSKQTQREQEPPRKPRWEKDSQPKETAMKQAAEWGGHLYKNASTFVKSGRERVAKAVEEWQSQQQPQQQAQQQQPTHQQPNRPRWTDRQEAKIPIDRFVDQDSSDEDPELEKQREMEWKIKQEAQRRAYIEQLRKEKEKQAQNRHATSPPLQQPQASFGSSQPKTFSTSSPNTRGSAPQSAWEPRNEKKRPENQAPTIFLQQAHLERQRGNDQFKQGQFGDAEAAYSRALAMLPAGHDHTILLRNNRAAARLRSGRYKQCIEDCDEVLAMAKTRGEKSTLSDGVTIHWRDQIAKGLQRKAEALEHLERFEEAAQTYKQLVDLGLPNQAQASQGLARCRSATAWAGSAASKTTFASQESAFPEINYDIFKPLPIPQSTESLVNGSKAVAEMRAKAAAQEAEEAEKLAKADQVNAKILQWKKGKERNLIALLATLDTLMWPGAQWKGAPMSDLIQPKKCKIAYMRAIAKVHPDKLPQSATVEQRMLASSIFTALNEAWDIFKTQNNL